MLLVVVVLLAALALGWSLGGSLDRLGAVPLRRRRLVVAAVAVQLAGALLGGPAHALGLVGSLALVVAFLLANRGVRGTGLIALGLGLNALVVVANGAMPVRAEAAGRAGVDLTPVLDGSDARHELETSRTRLSPLGDVVPLPLPLRGEVVSPGDVVLAAGVGQLVVLGMGGGIARGAAARRRPRPSRGRHARAGTRPPPSIPVFEEQARR